jgi:hypothetical protein
MMQETPQSEYEEAFGDVAGARVFYLHAGSGRPILLIHGPSVQVKIGGTISTPWLSTPASMPSTW